MAAIDVRIARIAATQYGLVTRTQLVDCGLSARQIELRLASGVLAVMARGVYRLAAHRPSWEQQLLAACLAAGSGAVASHRAAAALWQMRGITEPPVEITSPRRRPEVSSAVVHTTSAMDRIDVTTRLNVPVTAPARTVFDCAAVCPVHLIERILDDTVVRGLASHGLICRTYERLAHGRRGAAVLGRLLAQRDCGSGYTESELESAILDVLRAGGLPEPVRQHWVGKHRLDLAYPAVKLGIEGDSTRWHTAREHLQRNAAKRNALLHRGWRLLYFTWAHAHDQPQYIVTTVTRELDQLNCPAHIA